MAEEFLRGKHVNAGIIEYGGVIVPEVVRRENGGAVLSRFYVGPNSAMRSISERQSLFEEELR